MAGVEAGTRREEPGEEGKQEASGESEAYVRSSSREAGGEDKEVARKMMTRGTQVLVCGGCELKEHLGFGESKIGSLLESVSHLV